MNRDELERLVREFDEIDRNGDGQIEIFELMGFGPPVVAPRDARPEGRGPGRGRGSPTGRPSPRGPEGRGPEGRGPEGRGPEGRRPRVIAVPTGLLPKDANVAVTAIGQPKAAAPRVKRTDRHAYVPLEAGVRHPTSICGPTRESAGGTDPHGIRSRPFFRSRSRVLVLARGPRSRTRKTNARSTGARPAPALDHAAIEIGTPVQLVQFDVLVARVGLRDVPGPQTIRFRNSPSITPSCRTGRFSKRSLRSARALRGRTDCVDPRATAAAPRHGELQPASLGGHARPFQKFLGIDSRHGTKRDGTDRPFRRDVHRGLWSLMPMFQLTTGGSKSALRQRGSRSVSSWMTFISARNGIIARLAFTPLPMAECAARPRDTARNP